MSKNKHKADEEVGSIIYDYTYHKLVYMIDQLERTFVYHPDIDALRDILECYAEGEIDIFWEEGYPMPDLPDLYDTD